MTASVPVSGNPLRLYLRGEQVAINEIIAALQDASADAQRRINKLETKNGIGSIVRRAQLALVKRELRAAQDSLWKSVNTGVRRASPLVANAAAEAERVLQAILFQSVGRGEPEALVLSQRAYAQRTMRTFLSRGKNGIGLSQRVYRTRQLAQGFVDRQINRVVLQGGGWQELARSVRPLIDPNTPGGVSYAAKRLARTELNNAFHTTQRDLAEQNPFVLGVRWNLSRSHPTEDKCDEYARGHSKGKPAGIYLPGECPDKPHPQCLCFTTNEMMEEDDFLDLITQEGFLEGTVQSYDKPEEVKKAAGAENVVSLPRRRTTAPSKSTKKPTVAQLSRQKPKDVARLGGSTAYTDLVTYPDGSKLIHKVNGSRAQSIDFDVEEITDAEVLGAKVLEAFGLRAPQIHRAGPAEVWMEYIEGEVGGDPTNQNQARRLGLADHGMGQFDRNEGNWIIDRGGNLVGIDHGSAWLEGTDLSKSPFARFVYEKGSIDLHPEDVEEAIRRMKGVRPEFEKLGKLDWFNWTVQRYESLREKTSESAERIWR